MEIMKENAIILNAISFILFIDVFNKQQNKIGECPILFTLRSPSFVLGS
jgi:hypothetical protein